MKIFRNNSFRKIFQWNLNMVNKCFRNKYETFHATATLVMKVKFLVCTNFRQNQPNNKWHSFYFHTICFRQWHKIRIKRSVRPLPRIIISWSVSLLFFIYSAFLLSEYKNCGTEQKRFVCRNLDVLQLRYDCLDV